jgi:hypothetical protein
METSLATVTTSPVLQTIDEAPRAVIQQAVRDLEDLDKEIAAYQVTDDASAARVTEYMTLAGAAQTKVEDLRLSLVQDIKRRAAAIDALFRPLNVGFDAVIRTGKDKVRDWNRAKREEERKRLEEIEARKKGHEAAAREAAKDFDEGLPVPVGQVLVNAVFGGPTQLAPDPEPPPAPTGIRTDYGTASERWTWTYEVVDLRQVPTEYLLVDARKVKEAIRAGARDVSGLRIFQEDDIQVRPRR